MNTQTQSTVARSASTSTSATTKVIKRYQNRKLYDTQQSCYVTLEDIAKMIRTNEDVTVVDNKTKRDITASTLAQIIFEAEKKVGEYAPLTVLREIIQSGNGSMSSYLAKLGVFTPEAKVIAAKEYVRDLGTRSFDDVKSTLDSRVAAAAEKPLAETKAGVPASPEADFEPTPTLPNSNRSLNN